MVDGEPSSIAIFERDVFLTGGNYFDDLDEPPHGQSLIWHFGPTANVETRILEAIKTGTGTGTVFSSSPAGLGCGTACKGEFNRGRTVFSTPPRPAQPLCRLDRLHAPPGIAVAVPGDRWTETTP